MEVQKILAHDEHLLSRVRAVIRNRFHDGNRFLKSSSRPADPVLLQTVDDFVHGLFKSGFRATCGKFIRTDFPQQLLEHIDHRKGKGDAHGGNQIHLKSRVHIVVIHIVIGDDRHIGETGVIQSLSKQGTVMGQPAVPDIFSHRDGNLTVIVLSALQCGEGLSDDDLGRKTDVIVDIQLSETDGFLPSDRKRFCPKPLPGKRRRHNPTERMGSIRYEHDLVLPVFLCKLHRIRVM